MSEDEVRRIDRVGVVRSCSVQQFTGKQTKKTIMDRASITPSHLLLLQTWLELSPPAAAPKELTLPCARVGSNFYRLCMEAKENNISGGDRSKNLLMEDFARAGESLLLLW